MNIDLSDLTFIIPLGIETDHRLRNFLLTSDYLLKTCPDSSFIIHEIGPVNHIDNINSNNLKKIYTPSNKIEDRFHKTWCINRCLEQTKTKICCIYDVDVLLELNNISKSVELIENGFDMVLPYGFGLYQKQILNFEECLNFKKCFNFFELKTINYNNSFYGHVQFFNTNSYVESGGENEEMIGYGPEDQEKLYKMQELDYKVSYLDNCYVWHIEHTRANPTPWFSAVHDNNVKIFDKIKNMNKTDKKNYYEQKGKILKEKRNNYVSII